MDTINIDLTPPPAIEINLVTGYGVTQPASWNSLEDKPSTFPPASSTTQELGVGTLKVYDPVFGDYRSLTVSDQGLFLDSIEIAPISYVASQIDTRQPIDADLTAIAGLVGTTGFLKKTAANTWSLDTASYIIINSALGTPTSGVLTSCTGLPISTGVSGLGTGVATFLATPSSANLAAALTDESGSGSVVFSASPTFTGTASFATITTTGNIQVGTGGAQLKNAGGSLELRNAADNAYATVFTGIVRSTGSIWVGGSNGLNVHIYGTSTGVMELYNSGETGFDRICLGVGSSSTSGPAIKRNGTAVNFRLANDSADCPVTASLLTLSDGLVFSVVGKAIQYKAGTGARAGNATLVGGTVTISMATATANTVVIIARKTAGGTVGDLRYSVTAGSSITITSASASDTSVVSYHAIEVA